MIRFLFSCLFSIFVIPRFLQILNTPKPMIMVYQNGAFSSWFILTLCLCGNVFCGNNSSTSAVTPQNTTSNVTGNPSITSSRTLNVTTTPLSTNTTTHSSVETSNSSSSFSSTTSIIPSQHTNTLSSVSAELTTTSLLITTSVTTTSSAPSSKTVITSESFHLTPTTMTTTKLSTKLTSKTTTTTTTTTVPIQPTTTPRAPIAEAALCNDGGKGFCKNGGICVNETSSSKSKRICICTGDYFGDQCQKTSIPDIYRQLTYGLAAATGFLLLVVILLLCCRLKGNKKLSSNLEYSKELDDYDISSNKRASVMANKNAVGSYENNIGMYGN